MTSINLEQWFHASDGEREALLHYWRTDSDEGLPIVEAVAGLLQRECIYEVDAAEVAAEGSTWIIDAYLVPDDYALLRNRKPGKFLGIPIRFNESRAATTTH